MQTVAIDLPDSIAEVYHHDENMVKDEVQRGFLIWEYLNGHISLGECGAILKIGMRGFMELLWSKGIPLDGLSDAELNEQVNVLEKMTTEVQ